MSKWSYVALGEICEITGGNSAPQGSEPFEGGTLPFVRMRDLGRYHFTSNLDETDDKLTEDAVQKYRMKIFEPGCILFPRSGSVFLNHRAILGIRASIVSHIGVLHKFSDLINVKFLYYYLQTYDMTRLSKKTTGVDSIAFSDVVKIKVPLPPLPEQERIVSLLDEAESLRVARERANVRMEQIIPALFHEMFGYAFAGQAKDTPLVRLDSICTKITDGTHVTPKYLDHGVPFLSVKNITKKLGSLDFSDVKYISREEHEKISRLSNVERDDLLYTKVGATYGYAQIVDTDKEFSIFVSVALLKPDKAKIIPKYLEGVMNTDFIKNQADRRIKGIGVPDLHLKEIRSFIIPLPPLNLQQKFAERVKEAREIQSAQGRSTERVEALYQSMLDRAFKGEL